LGVLWKPLIKDEIYKEFVLEEGTEIYENWIDSPIPMYLEIYLFDWVNSDEMANPDVKPKFVEKGPYVFKEIHERVDAKWSENATVTFKQRRIWHFEEEMSKGKLTDTVTTIDVLYVVGCFLFSTKHQKLNNQTLLIFNQPIDNGQIYRRHDGW
jgi:hypothetical protein